MSMAEQLSENSRQGFAAENPPCIGLETDLSRNLRWGCSHIYDETPVGLAVYVRNDPVNLVDPDGRFSVSVFQGLQSMFLTGAMFNSWFQEAMGITTINDFSGAASLPGYSGPNPTLIAYLAEVDKGQDNLRKIEQAKKEEAKKAEALPEGTVTVVEGSKIPVPKGSTVCEPVAFKITGVGPKQAQNTTAITQTPRAEIPDGGVAIKPRNFGVERVNGKNREVLSEIFLYADWISVNMPDGLPSTGPYFPVDVIGPASVRNSPGNHIDVYNYTSQTQAWTSTRTVTVTAVIPANRVGVRCPE